MATCTPYNSTNLRNIPNVRDPSSDDLSQVSLATLTVNRAGHNLVLNYNLLNSKVFAPGDVLHIFGAHSWTVDCCVVEKPDQSVVDSFLAAHKAE